MGTQRVLRILLVTLMVVVGSASPAGAATPAPEPVSTAFRLDDSNGYSLYVFAYSEDGDGRGEVTIVARRKGTAAAYRAFGTVTPEAIRADFGALGKIDVVLNRSGKTKTFRRPCWDPEPYEPGAYEGTIRFNGEHGFARARQTRAPLVPLPIGSTCGSGSGESREDGHSGARLRGISHAHGRTLEFQFNKNHPKGRTLFSVEIHERRDGIEIFRAMEGFAGAGAFAYAPDLKTARLGLPPPFSGSASLHRSPDSVAPILTGNLEVDFPGRPGVRLTGVGVHVSLVHACFTRSTGPTAKSC